MTNEQTVVLIRSVVNELNEARGEIWTAFPESMKVEKTNIIGQKFQTCQEIEILDDLIRRLNQNIKDLGGEAS